MEYDRRLRCDERPTARILLVWLGLSAVMLAVAYSRIAQGQFPDPDDALRLVQVRDLLGGQGWFDMIQHRIDPPHGTPMHWSRLVDGPIALMVGLLSPLFGQAWAETLALAAIPLLTFGATLAVVGRLAWRLFGPQAGVYACLACGFMPALLFQFQPMRIDHHGWQIFCAALALWALSWREASRGGIVAGLAMALGLSISIEMLPLAAAFAGVLVLRWMRDGYQRWWLVGYLQALALGLVVLFAALRGLGDTRPYCDAVSPAHLGFFLIVALGAGMLSWRGRATNLGLLVGLGASGLAGLAFFALSAPTCIAAPFSDLDPLVHDYWYVHVLEGRPAWYQPLDQSLPALVQIVVALGVALMLRGRAMGWPRHWWSEYALLLLAASVLSLFVWRSVAFASVFAAVPLGWLATELFGRLRRDPAPLAKLTAAAAIFVLLVPSAPISLAGQVIPFAHAQSAVRVSEAQCDIREQARKLGRLPRGTVFAPLDVGPAILLESDHSVVATSHHRAKAAMADVIRAFISPAAEARPIVAAHHADYLVLCTDLGEPQLYAHMHPEGLAAQLLNGRPPTWLEPLDLGGPPEFAAYRVRR